MTQIGFSAKNVFLALTLLSISSIGHAAREDDEHDRMRAAFGACAVELKFEIPKPGSRPPKISDEQRQALDDCLGRQGVNPPGPPPGGPANKKLHQQMKSCLSAASVNVPMPEPGSPPPKLSDEQKAALDSCRTQVENQSSSNEE